MPFNLIVDQGNTTCKVAFIRNNTIENITHLQGNAGQTLEPILAPHQFDKAIYASVGSPDKEAETIIKNSTDTVIMMGAETLVPIHIAYNRTTLGVDRLAAAVGAYSISAGKEILVIDAGTAITYERITANGTYLGGNISPGIGLRFKALHHFTGRLPLIPHENLDLDIPEYGKSTQDAILSGVISGLTREIESYINDLYAKYESSCVILTGGDTKYLAQKIHSRALIHPDLVLLGLNRILEHNV